MRASTSTPRALRPVSLKCASSSAVMYSPSSIERARRFSSSAVSRLTLPISRRYMRTGSSMPSSSSARRLPARLLRACPARPSLRSPACPSRVTRGAGAARRRQSRDADRHRLGVIVVRGVRVDFRLVGDVVQQVVGQAAFAGAAGARTSRCLSSSGQPSTASPLPACRLRHPSRRLRRSSGHPFYLSCVTPNQSPYHARQLLQF